MQIKLLRYEEGYRSKPYFCIKRFPTIAVGKRIGPKNADLGLYQFTVPLKVADVWLECDLESINTKLNQYSWFKRQNADRKAVLVSMAYQLGVKGLFGFKNMIRALKADDYATAYTEALDSKWYKLDTPTRALRHATVLRDGCLETVYKGRW